MGPVIATAVLYMKIGCRKSSIIISFQAVLFKLGHDSEFFAATDQPNSILTHRSLPAFDRRGLVRWFEKQRKNSEYGKFNRVLRQVHQQSLGGENDVRCEVLYGKFKLNPSTGVRTRQVRIYCTIYQKKKHYNLG